MNVTYTAHSTAVSVRGDSGSCPAGPAREDDPTPPPIKVRASVFFDGTGNNMFNTRSGDTHDRSYRSHASEDGGDSYANDYSNVAKLAQYILTESEEDDYHFSVYVEGIGTTADDGDSSVGGGTGWGETGVVNRVRRAIERLTSTITSLDRNHSRNISELNIDAFGFSRGATCARHFGYRIYEFYGRVDANGRPLIIRLRDNGFTLSTGSTRIKLMGLFDTVASFGADHDDDTNELHLEFNAYIGHVDKIVHLVAAEEFRMNFRLTDCRSAGRKVEEIYLPGVHSDIGGGYNRIENELDFKVFEIPHSIASMGDGVWPIQRAYITLMTELIQHGNYRATELVNGSSVMPFVSGNRNVRTEITLPYIGEAVVANRRGISNEYSRVALKMMAEKFGDASLNLDGSFDSEIRLNPFLAQVYGVLNNNSHPASYWITAAGASCGFDISQLRHDYFHTSAEYNTRYPLYGCPFRLQFKRNGRYVDLDEDTIDNGIGFSRERIVNPG